MADDCEDQGWLRRGAGTVALTVAGAGLGALVVGTSGLATVPAAGIWGWLGYTATSWTTVGVGSVVGALGVGAGAGVATLMWSQAAHAPQTEDDRRDYPLPKYLESAEMCREVNIAITGSSGTGKSSFINALRRMRRNDEKAARVGVTETTSKPQKYVFSCPCGIPLGPPGTCPPIKAGERILLPDGFAVVRSKDGEELDVLMLNGGEEHYRKVSESKAMKLADCSLWDLPGVGTEAFPQETYIVRMGLRYFDVVVLMTAERLTESERTLIEELRRFNVPHFLVRSKTDAAVEANVKLEEDLTDFVDAPRKQEIKEETLRDIKLFFEKSGFEKVYMISTFLRHVSTYDFPELEHDIVMALKTGRGVHIGRECPVCFEEYQDYNGGGGERKAAPCGHSLCSKCLQIIQGLPPSRALCPECRRPLDPPLFPGGGGAAA